MKRIERPAPDDPLTFQHRHWEEAWSGWTLERIEASVQWEGILPLARSTFAPGARLLEAGCGTGKYCIALDRLGYEMTGIDYSQAGLDVMQRLAPHLTGVLGSVLDIPFPAGYFDGALSLGVVEHFEEGPEKAISELARVVRSGGKLFLTVPLHNKLHQWEDRRLIRAADDSSAADRRVFYQYLFKRDEMRRRLEIAGFRIDKIRYLDKRYGLSEFSPFKSKSNGHDTGGAPAEPAATSRPWSLKSALKKRTPALARALRDAQLRFVEGALPGSVCAHLVAFVCTRE